MTVTQGLLKAVKLAGGPKAFQKQLGLSRQLYRHYIKTGRVGSPETVAHIRYHFNIDLYPPKPYKASRKATIPPSARYRQSSGQFQSRQPVTVPGSF